jgi:hypothetical protein
MLAFLSKIYIYLKGEGSLPDIPTIFLSFAFALDRRYYFYPTFAFASKAKERQQGLRSAKGKKKRLGTKDSPSLR